MRWKILILLGTLLPGVTVTHAQYTYQPFVKEGKMWFMFGWYDEEYWIDHHFKYQIQGDTIIGGEAMKKVYIIDEERFHDNFLYYLGAVREDNHKVSVVYAGEDNPILLYDFDAPPSSVISYGENEGVRIDSRSLIQLNSISRYCQNGVKWYNTEGEIIPYTVQQVEGLGSIKSMDPFLFRLWNKTIVTACYEDGACLYYYGDFNALYDIDPAYASLLKHDCRWDCHDNTSGKNTIQMVVGDTIFYNDEYNFSGQLFHKVYCADSQKYGDTELHYYGAMREEGKKVWLVPDGKWGDDRELLFNFGLKKGDEAEVAGCTVKVVGSDSIISEGRKYRRLTLHQMEQGRDTRRTCHWTEGIGSDCGIVYPLPWDAADKSRLVVCDGDISIYDQSTVDLAVDNPYVEKRGMPTNDLFDLQGRHVTGQPRRGVYIQDGRKRVR